MVNEGAKIEAARGEGHIANVMPVGDVDVVAGQHCFDRRAQQCREMTRHGSHQENPWLCRPGCLLEVKQRGEGRGIDRLFRHRNETIAVRDGFDSKREPGMDNGQIGEGFQDSSEPVANPAPAEAKASATPIRRQRRAAGPDRGNSPVFDKLDKSLKGHHHDWKKIHLTCGVLAWEGYYLAVSGGMHYALVFAGLRGLFQFASQPRLLLPVERGHWTTQRSRSAARTIPHGRFAAG
jgi:hypothetical protein